MTARILLAEDHAVFRQGLRSLLEREPGWSVVAEAGDGRSAVGLALELLPDVAILDIGLPELNGIEAARKIVDAARGVRVVCLSMHAQQRFVQEMLRAGAAGYVLKEEAYEELLRAVREVLAGRIYLSPRVGSDYIRRSVRALAPPAAGAFGALTPREREVVQLIAEGRSTKEIAGDLGVSVKTVESFRQSVMAKLGLHSVAELTKYAIREGLTDLGS